VCLILTSLPTVVLLAAANSFDSRHDIVMIVGVWSQVLGVQGVTARASESGVRLERASPLMLLEQGQPVT
jgi:hypothetical protein